jgi:hypothetical protein
MDRLLRPLDAGRPLPFMEAAMGMVFLMIFHLMV